jgi:hypothetical protein
MFDNRPEIYIDLDKCMTEEEVVVTLAHEMSHALEAIQHRKLMLDHGQRWRSVAQIYARALNISRIAMKAPNLWVTLPTIVRIQAPPRRTQLQWPREITIAPMDAEKGHADLQEPAIIIDDPVVLQENLQELIPTMNLVKKVIETELVPFHVPLSI